jgi:hypothetical protein
MHNEDPHNLHPSPNIRMIDSKRIRWARHVASMGNEKCV